MTNSINIDKSTLNPKPYNDIKYFDIRCIMHTLCNLNCKFCFETKEKGIREYTKINIDYIRNLPNEIIKVILPIIEKHRTNNIIIALMGGELFSDNIPDSIFDVYKEFLYDISNKLNKIPNVNYQSYAVSNGVYFNHKRVETFLKEFNTNLTLSYDPIDRFNNNKQKEIWLDTFNYFRDKNVGLSVAILLTKRNIYSYMNGDNYFNLIGNNIHIVNHEYFPRLDYHDYLPNDDDLYNFYKWCIDNDKYNMAHVYNFIISKLNNFPITTCYQNTDYMFGEGFDDKYGRTYINQCAENPLSIYQYYGKYSNQIIDDTDCLKYKQPIGLQKRGCLYCEYYSYCPKMCWSQIAFKEYKITQCPIKRIYQYIDKDNTIIDRFNIWRDKNESSKPSYNKAFRK